MRNSRSAVRRPRKTRRRPFFERLEDRIVLTNPAHDLIDLTDLRNDPKFEHLDGAGVCVAVIDEAADATHPLIDLADSFDAVANRSQLTLSPGESHGTHVAGIIGARDPDIAVAPGVCLISIDVFRFATSGDAYALDIDVERALRWVQEKQAEYNIVAVNMSLGSGYYTSPALAALQRSYVDEIRALENAGVTVVSAAGNNYVEGGMTENSATPGINSTLNVLAVYDERELQPFVGAALTPTTIQVFGDTDSAADRIASFSQRPVLQTGNSLAAPGAFIYSTVPGPKQFDSFPGTSMAAPMVSGAVALMQQAALEFGGRTLPPAEIRNLLLNSADTVVDGDDEQSFLFDVSIDENGQFVTTEQTFRHTGNAYKRLNVYSAVKAVEEYFALLVDPNATTATAIQGPSLAGRSLYAISPIGNQRDLRTIQGQIGRDGTHSLGARDIDLYRFDVLATGDVTVELTPGNPISDFDSYLRLFDANGTALAADDGIGNGVGAKIELQLEAGTYFAGVSASGNQSYDVIDGTGAEEGRGTGTYTINFSFDFLEADGTIATAVPIDLSTGFLEFGGYIGIDQIPGANDTYNYGRDVDMFQFVAPDRGTVTIDLDTARGVRYSNANPSRAVDTYVRVFTSQGQEIAANDDGLARNLITDELTECARTDGVVRVAGGCSGALSPLAMIEGYDSDSFLRFEVSPGERYFIAISNAGNSTCDPTNLSDRTDGISQKTGSYHATIEYTNFDLDVPLSVWEQDDPGLTLSLNVQESGSEWIGSDQWTGLGTFSNLEQDVDLWKLVPQSDGLLEIRVQSHSDPNISDKVNTVITLFDADGQPLGQRQSRRVGDPSLSYEVTAGQTYVVGFSGAGNNSYDPNRIGSGSPTAESGQYAFTIDLKPIAERPDNDRRDPRFARRLPGSGRVAVAESLGSDDALIRGQGDLDYFFYVPDRSTTIEIRTEPIVGAAAPDTVLTVFDAATNSVVATNDDVDGSRRTSALTIGVTAGHEYFILVEGNQATDLGDYVLVLESDLTFAGDPDDQKSEAIPLAKGVAQTGFVDPVTDVDLYSFTASAGEEIEISVSTSTSGFTPRIRVFGFVLGNDDQPVGTSITGTFRFTPSTSGTYYVGISELSNEFYSHITGSPDFVGPFAKTGNYTLLLTGTTRTVDLQPVTADGPNAAEPGDSIPVITRVNNNGNESSGSYTVQYFLSNNATITASDTLLKTTTRTSIAGGSFSSWTETVTIPTTIDPGTYFVGVIVDPANLIVESNELNNSVADGSPITITGPADVTPPGVVSFVRQNPTSSPTNANSLVFRATFTETVIGVDAADFSVNGATTAGITSVTAVAGSNGMQYDVTVSGGNLASFNGAVGLNLAASVTITDPAGNALIVTEPTIDQTYTVDNTPPTIAVNPLVTNDVTPLITGTFSDGALQVTLNNKTYQVGDGNLSASGTTWMLQVPAANALTAGVYDVTASAVDAAGNQGNDLTTGELSIDLSPPTVQIAEVTPDPRSTHVGEVAIEFSEAVTGVDIGDFRLTRDGNVVSLQASMLSGSSHLYALNLSSVTAAAGTYQLTITAAGSQIRDAAGNELVGNAAEQWSLVDDDAVLDVILVAVAAPTPDGSSQLPESISQVAVNSSYYLEVWVQERLENADGIQGGRVDLRYNPTAIVDATAISHQDFDSGGLSSGTIRDDDGLVDELGGATFASGKGNAPGFARLAYVTMQATDRGTVSYSLQPADFPFAASGQGNIDWSLVDLSSVVQVEHLGGAQVDVRLVKTPTATSASGEVDQLPTSESWLNEWEPYWVEIFVNTPHSTTEPVTSANVVLDYTTSLTSATAVEFGPAFTVAGQPTIDDAAGQIVVAATAGQSHTVGDDRSVLLARIRFEPGGNDQAEVDEANRALGPYALTVGISDANVALAGNAPAAAQRGENVTTDVWAVMYDLDENDRIDFGDFSFFAPRFAKNVDAGDPLDWWADFDGSGVIDFGDFSFFAPNFGKAKPVVNLQFPGNFPPAPANVAGRDDSGSHPAAPSSAVSMLRDQTFGAEAESAHLIDIELVALSQPSPSDSAAQLPTSVSVIGPEESYVLEIWVGRTSGSEGISGGTVDVRITPAGKFQFNQLHHSETFNILTRGSFIQPDLIEGFGGATLQSDAGVTPQWARLGWIELSTVDLGEITHTLEPSSLQFGLFGLGNTSWDDVDLDTLRINVAECNRSMDINGDGAVTHLDVIVLVNHINQHGVGPSSETVSELPCFDISGDGVVSPLDVVLVVNFINSLVSNGSLSASGEGESMTPFLSTAFGTPLDPSPDSVPGQSDGMRGENTAAVQPVGLSDASLDNIARRRSVDDRLALATALRDSEFAHGNEFDLLADDFEQTLEILASDDARR